MYKHSLQCEKKKKKIIALPIEFFPYSGHQMNNNLFNILLALVVPYALQQYYCYII